MDQKTTQEAEDLKKFIIGGAYISDIIESDKKVGERFGASISREALEKLKTSEKGEAKISFFENTRKREDKKDPDLIITVGRKSAESIASIFIDKEAMLKEEGDKYINFLVSDKNPINIKTKTSRNMVVFSDQLKGDGLRNILGSGWHESHSPSPSDKAEEITTNKEIKIARVLKKFSSNDETLPNVDAIGIDENKNIYQGKKDDSKNLVWTHPSKETKKYISEHIFKKGNDIMFMPGGVPEDERNLFLENTRSKANIDDLIKPDEVRVKKRMKV